MGTFKFAFSTVVNILAKFKYAVLFVFDPWILVSSSFGKPVLPRYWPLHFRILPSKYTY